MRNEKFQFKNIIKISLVLTLLYVIVINISLNYVKISAFYGYKMYLQSPEYFYLFKAFANTLFLIFSINLLGKNYLDKKGMYLIIIASITAIVEIVITMLGIRILQENILSDFCFMIAFVYALNKLKK